MYLIIIDIGNTQTTLTCFEVDNEEKSYRSIFDFRINNSSNLDYSSIFSELKKQFLATNFDKSKISKISIVSVVKELTDSYCKASKEFFNLEPTIITHKNFLSFENMYYDINELGLDRLCNAFAAYKKFAKSVIVIDFGSAITFEIIDTRGVFVGGMILPGIKLNSEILNSKTSLLPKINLNKFPDKIIGRSTEECISSGIIYGTLELCKGLVTQIEEELGEKENSMTVVITGGYSHLFSDKLGRKVILEKDLVSLGALFLILNGGN